MPEAKSPGQIYETVEKFRRELLRSERRAASEMVHYYGQTWRRIKEQADDLLRMIREARDAGEEVSPAWLFRYRRLEELQEQVEAELRNFVGFAESQILEQQGEAVRAAQEHSEKLVLEDLLAPPEGVRVHWNRLPIEATQDLVGFLHDGSPLRALLDELPGQAGQAVADELVQGVALGLNSREISRRIRRAAGVGLVRALRIARTETMRAYREATRRSYQANSDVVKGWIWHAALDRRTCPMCWAMHGTQHGLDETLGDHPNGRCTMIPWVASWEELGFEGAPDTRVVVEPGESIFKEQPEDVQRAVLGNAGYEAWKRGEVTLRDFVGEREDPRWGRTFYAKSLRSVLGAPVSGPPTQPGWLQPGTPSSGLDDTDSLGQLLYERSTLETAPEGLSADDLIQQAKDVISGERYSKLKDRIVTQVSERSGLDYEVADKLTATWAASSGDEVPLSVVLQTTAQEVFGLPSSGFYTEERARRLWKEQEERMAFYGWGSYEDAKKKAGAYLRAVYEITQEELRERGIRTVTVLRGLDLPLEEARSMSIGDMIAHTSNPLSSWTVHRDTAEFFAGSKYGAEEGHRGVVLRIQVPAERIFSTSVTGAGCLPEGEVVLLGGIVDTTSVVTMFDEGANRVGA